MGEVEGDRMKCLQDTSQSMGTPPSCQPFTSCPSRVLSFMQHSHWPSSPRTTVSKEGGRLYLPFHIRAQPQSCTQAKATYGKQGGAVRAWSHMPNTSSAPVVIHLRVWGRILKSVKIFSNKQSHLNWIKMEYFKNDKHETKNSGNVWDRLKCLKIHKNVENVPMVYSYYQHVLFCFQPMCLLA